MSNTTYVTDAEIVMLAERGKTRAEIIREYRVSTWRVGKVLDAAGIYPDGDPASKVRIDNFWNLSSYEQRAEITRRAALAAKEQRERNSMEAPHD